MVNPWPRITKLNNLESPKYTTFSKSWKPSRILRFIFLFSSILSRPLALKTLYCFHMRPFLEHVAVLCVLYLSSIPNICALERWENMSLSCLALKMGFVFCFTSNILVIYAVPIGDVAQVLEIKSVTRPWSYLPLQAAMQNHVNGTFHQKDPTSYVYNITMNRIQRLGNPIITTCLWRNGQVFIADR